MIYDKQGRLLGKTIIAKNGSDEYWNTITRSNFVNDSTLIVRESSSELNDTTNIITEKREEVTFLKSGKSKRKTISEKTNIVKIDTSKPRRFISVQ